MGSVFHLHLADTTWFAASGRLPFWADWYAHPPKGTGRHDHDFVELGLVTKGTTIHRWAGGEERVGPGSLVVVQPGAWHDFGPCPFMAIYNICMAEHLLHQDMAWLLKDPVLKYLLVDGPVANGRSGVLITKISDKQRRRFDPQLIHLHETLKRMDEPTWLEKMLAIGNVMEALASAVRVADPRAASLSAMPRRHEAVRKIMVILERDLTRKWTTARLAEQVYLDRSYLVRLFHAQVGMPPLAYQTRLRAERAANLLLTSDASIRRIGSMVGWEEPSHFSLRFREFFGVSPRQYRITLGRGGATKVEASVGGA